MYARGMVAVVVAAGLIGCASYAPIEAERIAAGEQVRLWLTREGSARLDAILDQGDRAVEGEVLDATADRVLVAVATGVRQQARRHEVLHQRVLISRAAVTRFERREIDRLRTAGMITAGAVVVGFLAWKGFSGVFGGPTASPRDGPAELRVPLVRIPLH